MKIRFTLALMIMGYALSTSFQNADIAGSWRGTSLCTDKEHFPACRDEQVIYDVKSIARDTVNLRADKVVNGVREFMGAFDFARAADSSWVAHYENPRVKLEIVLHIRANHMTGYMRDEATGLRPRQMSLDRVPPSR